VRQKRRGGIRDHGNPARRDEIHRIAPAPERRKKRIEHGNNVIGKLRRFQTDCLTEIGGKNPQPSALRDNADPVPRNFRLREKKTGDVHHLVNRIRHNNIGLPADSAKDREASGQRAGMRHGRARADNSGASLEQNDRFDAGYTPERLHEPMPLANAFHVKADDFRFFIGFQVVQVVFHRQIRLVARTYQTAQTDLPPDKPVGDRGAQVAALRNHGNGPRLELRGGHDRL